MANYSGFVPFDKAHSSPDSKRVEGDILGDYRGHLVKCQEVVTLWSKAGMVTLRLELIRPNAAYLISLEIVTTKGFSRRRPSHQFQVA